MKRINSRYQRISKIYPIYNSLTDFVVGSVFGGLFCSFLVSDIDFNLMLKLGLVFILIVIVIRFIGSFHFYILEKNKIEVPNAPNPNKIYKGLVVSISKAPNKENLIQQIDSLPNKIKIDKNPEKLLHEFFKNVWGIGQTFRAIYYHRGQLEVCWLLYTNQSKDEMEIVKHFIKKFVPIVNPIEIFIEDPTDFVKMRDEISRRYPTEFKENGLDKEEVIWDVTGGTTPMSGAIIIECKMNDYTMEYTKQDGEPELIELNSSRKK
ncbi:MAG: hypothetical protein ACPK85_06080 [Methanosarcina sp.]